MAELSQRDTEALLVEPNICQLATVHPDGRPHLAPIWFKWEGDKAYVMCGAGAVRVRNVLRNPAVTLSVANNERPYKYVVVEGTAEVIRDNLSERFQQICVRCEGPEKGRAYAQDILARGGMVVIEIKVTRIVGWTDGTG